MNEGLDSRQRWKQLQVCWRDAGFETTSNAMGWTLYCISQHPEVERRIQAELAEAGLLACEGNPHPRPVQWEDIGKLRYLEAVIKVPLPFPRPPPAAPFRSTLGKALFPRALFFPLHPPQLAVKGLVEGLAPSAV